MVRKFTFFVFFIFLSTIAYSQTTIQGKLTEEGTNEPVLFANVALYKNEVLITVAESDFDGNYSFSDLSPGTYDIEVSFLGLQTKRIAGVIAKDGKVNLVNIEMAEEGVVTQTIDIVSYKNPLIEFDNTTQGKSLTSESIQALPTKNISAIAATSAGVSVDQGGNISIRGSRANATNYYIDGIRVSGSSVGNLVPQAQIEQMQIITGGIEARYGDVTGGIISITTRGPSNQFSGGLELETSQYLDPYGYNLINGNFSGPILKNKDGQSVLGFRLFGQYRNIADDGPSAVGVYRASEELIDELEANPITTLNETRFPSTEFVTERPDTVLARVNRLDARPNETDRDINIGVNIDARLSKNIDISVRGRLFNSENRFAPSRGWELYNWRNNPTSYFEGFDGNIKIRHKLGKQVYEEGEERKDQILRNAFYSIQVGYEKSKSRNEDLRHQDRIFDYGYFGQQPREFVPLASNLTDPESWEGEVVLVGQDNPNTAEDDRRPFAHQGYAIMQSPEDFVPGAQNSVLANMNQLNGFYEQAVNGGWGLFSNVGQVYNTFSKGENETLTLNVNSGFDFLPGGSEKGKHNIQFGFQYEQRTSRGWSLAPVRLWELMRLNSNSHLNGVDTNNENGTFTQEIAGQEYTFQQYGALSTGSADEDAFYNNIRQQLGVPINQYINTDDLSPSDLSLDLFSAEELNNFGVMNYRGYDYLGNKVSSTTSFDDFFTATDANGNRTFNVAAFQPIYGAGYIQDKFTYKDIIFRLGVRMDYYDANTKVLRDPYSLTAVETASDFFTRTGKVQPEGVDNDYSVYVTGEGSESIKGYRLGEQWFKPDGTATSGNLLFGGGLVFPSYVEKDLNKRDPQYSGVDSEGNTEYFNTDLAFKDYDPQLNLMPRLAFSFPISEDAGFFAHYDVLVQRPTSNVIATALDYYYFNSATRFSPANNPNLKPEKTIDYEVGFQQKISNSSAIKVSAYYKEMRDMIQNRIFLYVPGVSMYETYDNLDFGTVKGFSFTYDMRRTGNFELNATYTLQFADGSGSGPNSSRGLNQSGVIRTLLPLSFDERHRFTAVADYRYGSGKSYNGPRIGNSDILANTGFNLLISAISGRPYSTYRNITTPLGANVLETINGARLPWVFNADLQIDKNLQFKFNPESERALGINLYLRITNVLNRKNVIGVYNVSGDPDNDGYLLNEFGADRVQQIIDTGLSLNSFQDSYNWRVLAPGNYSRPRQIFLGAIINF